MIYWSPKIFSSLKKAKPNSVILDLLPSSEKGKPCVALMNTCPHKWFKIVHTITRSTSGHWGFYCLKWSQDRLPSEAKVPKKFWIKWKPKYSFAKDLVILNFIIENEEINLIKMILRVTPHKRPTVQEILDHPYLNDDSKTTITS